MSGGWVGERAGTDSAYDHLSARIDSGASGYWESRERAATLRPPMILVIDTATAACSVALLDGGSIDRRTP